MVDELTSNQKNEIPDEEIAKVTAACGEAILAISLDAELLQSDLVTPDEVWCVVTGEGVPDFNMAMVAQGPHSLENFKPLVELLKESKFPSLIFTPTGDPLLKDAATNAGIIYAGIAPVMKLDMAKYSNPITSPENRKLTIELATDAARLREATKIQAGALEFDEGVINRTLGEKVLKNQIVDVFVCYENGIPVSTATVVRRGDSATIWNVGTTPERQRQGIGSETMASLLQLYENGPIKVFYLISSEAGKRLYDNIGFQTIYGLDTWLVSAET